MEITITGNDKKLLLEIENLAKKLGLKIKWKTKIKISEEDNSSQRLYDLMTEKANSGGIQSIKDPAAWQREQRKDKPLYGRD